MPDPQNDSISNIFSSSSKLVTSNIVPRKTDYYLVTMDQINTYSVVGYLATLYLTIFGVCAGGLYSSWLALEQNGLMPEFRGVLTTSKQFFLTGVIVFLSLSGGHIAWQYFFKKKHMFNTKL